MKEWCVGGLAAFSKPGSCKQRMIVCGDFSAYCRINSVVARLFAQLSDSIDQVGIAQWGELDFGGVGRGRERVLRVDVS